MGARLRVAWRMSVVGAEMRSLGELQILHPVVLSLWRRVKKTLFGYRAGEQIFGEQSCQEHVDRRWRLSFEFLGGGGGKRSSTPIVRLEIQNCT